MGSKVALSGVNARIIDSCREGGHTEYVIKVEFGDSEATIRRRYSAFIQFRKILQQHLQQGKCCQGYCPLEKFLKCCKSNSTLPKRTSLLESKNSIPVVNDRIRYFNCFLSSLQHELSQCPLEVMKECEASGCKVSKLIKSFFGAIEALPVSPSSDSDGRTE